MKKSFSKIQRPINQGDSPLKLFFLLVVSGFVLLFLFYLMTIFLFPSFFGKCVAVVEISGPLMVESVPSTLFSSSIAGSEEISEKISSISERPDIGAVVFVVNSPGGSVVASREIYQSIDSLEIPKVAYFKEVAASGGYYIATPADYIISEPYAITGSIGVISQGIEYSTLLENLGINSTTLKTGEHKDIGSEMKPMEEEEKQIMQEILDIVFEDFKSVILENRKNKLDLSLFEQALDGRIMLGTQAKQVGLVDDLGTKQDAINKASELAGLGENPRTCSITINSGEQGLFDMVSFFRNLFLSAESYGLQYSIK
ncbi:MAG: signal peptide peptidase SppA [Candidatus ainarchaeum sp.]|nr:signal peptide peptidase SppA [Candidatus ainarchaeum sp.]